jgi:NAD(P)-dependent dehydrogenase (short-subunit alcohol dehydrogenase family)
MASTISFAGQVAIVTGGGRGLGRAYCLDLARRGASVVVNDLRSPDDDPAADVVAEIERAGGRAIACVADVSSADGAAAIVDAAVGTYGRLDAVVSNAGIMRNHFLESMTDRHFDDVVAVNLRGSFLLARAAWPHLRTTKGRLVLISSAGGLFGLHACANYAASKAGVFGLLRALAIEGGPDGVVVNGVLPSGGPMASKDVPIPQWDGYAPDPDTFAALGPRQSAESVVPLVVYLASDRCAAHGEAFSSVAGRVARVFVGLTPGWLGDETSTAEDVGAHLDEITDVEGFSVPSGVFDEFATVADQLRTASHD